MQDPIVLALDAALIDANDINLIKKIIQENVKIVVVGNFTLLQRDRFQEFNFEFITLDDLKNNTKNYKSQLTYCFMGNTHRTSMLSLRQKFTCTCLETDEKLSTELEEFYEDCLEKLKSSEKSQKVIQIQNTLTSSNHGIFQNAPRNNSTGKGAFTPRKQPAIPPLHQAFPNIYQFTLYLADALNIKDRISANLPEMSLDSNGCLSIKINPKALGELMPNSFFNGASGDPQKNLIKKYNNIKELTNLFEPCGINFPQDGGYDLNLAFYVYEEANSDFSPEEIMSIELVQKKLQSPVLFQYCHKDGIFDFNGTTLFYLCECSKNKGWEFKQLKGMDIELGELKIDENDGKTIRVFPKENETTYQEIKSFKVKHPRYLNVEKLYRELCIKKGGLNFDEIWDIVKFPQILLRDSFDKPWKDADRQEFLQPTDLPLNRLSMF